MSRYPAPVEERLWARVVRSGGPDACWEWQGAINSHGYGTIRERCVSRGCHVSLDSKAEQGELVRCRLSTKPLDASGTEPKWNLIIPMGEYHGPTLAAHGGSFAYDAAFFSTLIENWKANGSFRIPVRWGHEHETNDNPAIAAQLDRKAANIIDLRVTEAGLEGLTAWNKAGRDDIESGTFDSWSAEYRLRHLNRVTGQVGGPLLTGVGLTNNPFFNCMPPVAASASAETTVNPQQEQHMDKEQLKKWAVSLGLSPDATLEQCISANATKMADLEAKVAASAKQQVPADVIAAAVKPSEERVVALSAKVKELEEKALERDVKAAIDEGKRGDGKMGRAITPELEGFIMATAKTGGLEEAKKLIAAIPASVPMTATGVDTKDDGKITASAAKEKLQAEADKLQKEGHISPWLTAISRNPELARIAQEGK